MAQCKMCVIAPKNYQEAAQDDSWKRVMQTELDIMQKNNTWQLVDKPFEKPNIGVEWVYKTNLNLDGSIQKNKARLVAKWCF